MHYLHLYLFLCKTNMFLVKLSVIKCAGICLLKLNPKDLGISSTCACNYFGNMNLLFLHLVCFPLTLWAQSIVSCALNLCLHNILLNLINVCWWGRGLTLSIQILRCTTPTVFQVISLSQYSCLLLHNPTRHYLSGKC